MLKYPKALLEITVFTSGDNNRFIKICVLVLLVAAMSLILKNFGFKGAPVVMAAAFCALISLFGETLEKSISVLGYFAEQGNISKYAKACIKVIGIGYLSGISTDTCKELGETGAAKCISVLTRLELIALSIPFITEIFDSALSLMGE